MSLLKRVFIGYLLTMMTLSVWSQCSSVKKQTFLVSDRYRDAARHDSHLLLANSHGLVFRDLNGLEGNPLHIEPLPGDITHVTVSGDFVYATAQDRGLHILAYEPDATFPRYLGFVTMPGLSKVVVQGNNVFAYRNGLLTYHRFALQDNGQEIFLPVLAQLDGPLSQFVASEQLLFVRREDGTVHCYSYDAEGFVHLRQVTTPAGGSFYGMSYAAERLVVDGLDGISWVAFTPFGVPKRTGTYYSNKDGEIVLGSQAKGSELFLRFADRIEAYQLTADRKILMGTIPQEFQDVGHVSIAITDGYFHLLNQAPQRREWSLASYQSTSSVSLLARLDALFEELVAGVSFGERIFLASNRDIFLADVENQSSFREQEPVWRFDGNIQSMVASENLLFVTAPVPGTGITRVYAFSLNEDGTLVLEDRRDMSGSVSQLSQYNDRLAFQRYVRNTSEDMYEINVLYRSENGFQLATTSEVVPLGRTSPFDGLHIGDLGLVYLRNNAISIYEDPTNLNQMRVQTFNRPLQIEAVASVDGHFWLQTEVGIYLYTPQVDGWYEDGYYAHWRGLTRLSNNMLLAQNVLRKNPGSFHLLSLEFGRLVNDRVDFSTSDIPIFIADLGQDILVGERASLNIFQFECPTQDFVYLLPVNNDLEMDLNTVLEPTDVVTLVINNRAGDVIGFQDLDPDLIALFNGRRLPLWLFDYNQLETPTTFTLMASKPMAPVLSGEVDGESGERFAYRVPAQDSGQLYLPHFPRGDVWNTRLYIRSANDDPSSTVGIQDPRGNNVVTSSFGAGSTTIVDLSGMNGIAWLRLVADDPGNSMSGFSLFSDLAGLRAAAVPLVYSPSSYLILPHLAGAKKRGSWTGMALANPHARTVRARVVAYNSEGVIGHDLPIDLAGNSSLVVSAESWLGGLASSSDASWLVVVPEEPIMGMVLYGNNFDPRLAGLPLTGSSGERLVFPGIRNKNWKTELQVTNQDDVSASLRVIAYDGLGEVLEEVELPIGPNENLGLDTATLFGNLSVAQVGSIQTIRVLSNTPLAGFAFRRASDEASLEAYSALVED